MDSLTDYSLNPLKRVNSILTSKLITTILGVLLSQSPQTGQFNSYKEYFKKNDIPAIEGLNPLKRVNSILT